jgi:glycogen operon protein
LHKAGIEVILDVVFNHTGESDHHGPTINFKGIDNSIYYYLNPQDKQYYVDYSGCGNTFNCNHPIVEKLIAECLGFWVKEMHVDGFRLDEASVLSRGEDGTPMRYPPVLWHIEMDESLADTKIIAEAWDAAGLYQVGNFPGYRWAVWNGHYRDDMRRFVGGDPGMVGKVASRIAGSADIYQTAGHMPINSINFITCHDGFTLNDLVSYNNKHNEANGEYNLDGTNSNFSWNCGVEGETNDAAIEALRLRQIKNFVAILLLSQGVPMLLAGDEVRRTQRGNNNAYCQDNETRRYY